MRELDLQIDDFMLECATKGVNKRRCRRCKRTISKKLY